MRKFFRTTYSLAVILLFLAAAVIGFTQTKVFRSYLRSRIVNTVAKDLHGELALSSVQGNLFTGFQVENVVLRQNGEPVITIERLEAKYDPLGLLTKSVAVSRLTLVNPVIHLTRSQAGAWNFARLLKPPSTDTTPSSWTVNLKQIQIRNGAVRLIDSLDLARRARDTSLAIWPGRFDYSNIELDSLNLDAGLDLRGRQVGLTLNSFACQSPHPEFRVKDVVGEFLLTPTGVSARKVKVETSKSRIRVDARLDSLDITNLTSLAQFQFAPVVVRLSIERLDFGELKQFIGSPIKFLERDVAGQIDVEGKFGLLDVRNITLRTGSTIVRIVGTVANLHHPADLELDLACVKNRADFVDLRHLMPTLGIPDLASLGGVEYDLRFKGKPTAFNARFAGSTAVGRIDVDGSLDLRGDAMSYDGTIKTEELNLAPLLGDSALASNLKTSISFQGRGTRLTEMTSLVRVEIDTSEFYGLPVSRSVAVMDVADATLRPRVSLHIGSLRVDLGGTLQIRPTDIVSYDLSGRINSLNLAEITKIPKDESDVSFDLKARGDVKTVSSLAGNLDLDFFRSSFDTVHFEGGTAAIRINTLDRARQTLSVASEVLDLDVQGRFTPLTVGSAIARGATLVGEVIRYRINSLDSLRGENSREVAKEFRPTVGTKHDSTDYRFTLNIKDCYPIGVVLGKGLDGQLTLVGHVKEAAGDVQLDGTAAVPAFRYADSRTSFAVEDGSVTYAVHGQAQARLLESMGLSLDARAKRFDIAKLQTANLSANLTMEADSGHYRIEALLDSMVTVQARGSDAFTNGLIVLNLDLLRADFNGYAIENVGPVRLRIGRDGLQIANLRVRHDTEELSASGYFDPLGISDVSVSARNVLLNNLPKPLQRAVLAESQTTMSGVVNAVASFKGSFEEPQFAGEFNASGVHYGDQTLGRVLLRSSYADHLLNVFAQLYSQPQDSTAEPDLLVNGTVPYNLSLRGESDRQLVGEMNLDVRSNNFHLAILDPFISELSNMSGVLVCNMKLRGTVESPSYEGSLELKNAQFLFNPLDIQYIVNGKFVPRGRQIGFEDFTVSNVAKDQSDGKVSLSGSFSLEGLKVRDFDLTANGQLLVMKEATRRVSQGLYGDLFVGAGPRGLNWKGASSRSFVSGEVFVKYANLTLPPTRQTQELPSSGITVTVIDDSKTQSKPGEAVAPKGSGLALRSNKPLMPVQQIPPSISKSFLDNIVYNLSVETQGVTQLRFVFSNFTNEQLLAEVKGRTAFAKDGDQMRLTGELELGSRSYYHNFKKLDATGKVRFTGDPLNPELDVVATYEGMRRDTSGLAALGGGSRLSGGSVKVVVKVYITGTRDQPKVRLGLAEYDQLGILLKERPDMEGDAIAFLVTGSFRDELTQQDKLSLAGSGVLGGVATSILSGPLTDLLRKEFGIVRSVDVLYYGGGTLQESADVRLTGEVGDAVFRLGGRVLSDLNNTNVSIQLPMSAIVGSEKWRHLVLQAERTVLGVETVDQRRESKGLRLLYRIIF